MTSKMEIKSDIDKGYAWVVLGACFMMRTLLEGFWSSMGILLVEWQTYFDASASDVAVIGSMAMVVILGAGPFSAALSSRLTFRIVGIVGGGMTTVFLFASSFGNQLWHIYFTMALAGIGIGLCLQITCVFCVFYFDKRLGLANGLCSSAAAIGTLCMPPLFQFLIEAYGWQGVCLVLSAVMANVILCSLLLKNSSLMIKKPNIKTRQGFCREIATDFDFSIWRHNVRFIFASLNGFWLGLGYHTAVIYVVPYADNVGISKMKASLLLSTMGICSLVGRLSHGWLIDKRIILPSHLGAISWGLSGIAILFIAITKTYSVLATLIAVFGFFTGIGHSLTFIIMKNAVGTQKSSQGFAWFLLNEAGGSLIGIYISGFLYDITKTYKPAFYLAGTSILCGCMFTLCDYFVERWQMNRTKIDETRREEVKMYNLLDKPAPNKHIFDFC